MFLLITNPFFVCDINLLEYLDKTEYKTNWDDVFIIA